MKVEGQKSHLKMRTMKVRKLMITQLKYLPKIVGFVKMSFFPMMNHAKFS